MAPALSRCLSRARRQPHLSNDLEHAALALFEVPVVDDECPVAPFRFLGDFDQPPEAYCLNADPVHLRADPRGLLLFDATSLAITAEEARQLAATVQTEILDDDGWTLQTGNPQHWYLTGSARPDLHSTPLSAVLGKPVGKFLPSGRAAAEWINRGNEMQMLLHNHPVNYQRALRGAPAINSVWFWGGGELPRAGGPSFDCVYSDDSLLLGLGLWSGSECAPLPAQANELLLAHSSGHLLLNLDLCRRPANYQDFNAWNAAVQRYERDWFAPLMKALLRSDVQMLELLPLDGYRYQIRKRDLWRLWRPVRSWRNQLAGAAS